MQSKIKNYMLDVEDVERVESLEEIKAMAMMLIAKGYKDYGYIPTPQDARVMLNHLSYLASSGVLFQPASKEVLEKRSGRQVDYYMFDTDNHELLSMINYAISKVNEMN